MKNKIFKISILILPIISFLQNKVQANTIIDKARRFLTMGANGSNINTSSVVNEIVPIGKILVEAATIVLVVVGLIMGAKYMLSGIDEKAKMKEKLVWYIVSIILVFGAVGIYEMVSGILASIQ